jgi:hypothetical protein
MDFFDFAPWIGKNAYNVQSDLELLYPGYQIVLLDQNTIITGDYRLNRIKILHDDNNVIYNITLG